MKNILLVLFVRMCQKFIRPNGDEKRILVVSTTALGDTLWATPAIENIRRSFPDAYIACLTSLIGKEVLKKCPWINTIYLLEHPFSLWRMLWRAQFDTVLLFHTSQRIVLPLVALIGAKQILGTRGLNKGLDSLLTTAIEPKYEHEIERRNRIAAQMGATIVSHELSWFSCESYDLGPGTWVVLHPGAKEPFRRWPAPFFAAVANRLQEEFGCRICLTGNATERPILNEIACLVPNAKILDVSLHSLASVLSQATLLISNDTGPLHIACALKRPVIGLYVSTDPNLCGPHLAPNARVISKPRTCDPCLRKKCASPFCFYQITVEEVCRAIASLYRK